MSRRTTRQRPARTSTPRTRGTVGRGEPDQPRGRLRTTLEGLDTRYVVAVLVVLVVAVVAAVAFAVSRGGDDSRDAALDRPPGNDPGVAHVHGLGVDPADGTLYAATHYGLFRIPESGPAARVANRYQDTMGFTVVGPGHFLGSGHPDPREKLPSRLGLIESTDAGKSWTTLSLSGQADFHDLEYRHDRVYGYDSGSGRFMVSTDRRTWESRASLPIVDFAVSPRSPDTVLAVTERGLVRSSDGGRTFSPVAGAPALAVLAWPEDRVLFGVAPDGRLSVSADGGRTWQARGQLNGAPEAMTAANATRPYVATSTGIYASEDGGLSFRILYQQGG